MSQYTGIPLTIPAPSSRNGTPGLQTVVLSPAPRAPEMSAAATKKLRDKEYQRKKRALVKAKQEAEEENAKKTTSNKRARTDDD